MTRQLIENKPLFYIKRPVVLHKTSRRFMVNDLLFFIK